MFAKIVNILIFAVILYYYLRKPLKQFLKERRKSISDLADAAHNTYNLAAAEEEKIRKRLRGAEEEIKQLSLELKKEAEFERSKIITGAKKYAEEMVKDAGAIAKNETTKAVTSIKTAIVGKAITLAKERLTTEATQNQYRKLADSAIEEIESTL